MDVGFLGYSKNEDAVEEELTSELIQFFTTGEIVVMENPEVAAELVAFKRYLIDELPSLRTDPEFETTWLPLLVFVNAALESMTPHVRRQGQQLASELNIDYLEPPIV